MPTTTFGNTYDIQSKIRTRKSIFDNGYISTSKDAWYGDDHFREKAYLQWNTSTFAGLGLSNYILTAIESDAIWELLITDVSENHTELFAQHDTLAGTVAYFATGPASIKLTITGKLPISGAADYRTAFLYQYIKNMRAKQLSYNDCLLGFVLKDTTSKIYILNLQLSESSSEPDMANIVISCLAYLYKNTYSTENLYTDVYSKTMSVPKTAATPQETKQESGIYYITSDPGTEASPTPVKKGS